MHEGVAPIVENIETPCNTCINIEYTNNGIKKMANGKTGDETVIISELLKWKMSHTCNQIMTIIDQSIQQFLSNHQLLNWINSTFKVRDKNQVSNYCQCITLS